MIDTEKELVAAIALQQIEGIGPVLGRRMMEFCGSFSSVFDEGIAVLESAPGIRKDLIAGIKNPIILSNAEAEAEAMNRKDIHGVLINDSRYPKRLKQCPDAPLVLFVKGDTRLNAPKMVSVVGMRQVSEYGERICRRLVEELSPYGVEVISGLAFGVDIIAHRTAVNCGLNTHAVFAHGLDRVYPGVHAATARKIIEEGGSWLSEFNLGAKPDRENFPKRNRIIAGLSDATIVVESDVKGGSMITATLAFDYDREVFACPGSVESRHSSGCHQLIRQNRATLIESAEDVVRIMNWEKGAQQGRQMSFELDWSPEEEKIVHTVGRKGISLDELALELEKSTSELSSLLLEMELKGIIRSVPGNRVVLG